MERARRGLRIKTRAGSWGASVFRASRGGRVVEFHRALLGLTGGGGRGLPEPTRQAEPLAGVRAVPGNQTTPRSRPRTGAQRKLLGDTDFHFDNLSTDRRPREWAHSLRAWLWVQVLTLPLAR